MNMNQLAAKAIKSPALVKGSLLPGFPSDVRMIKVDLAGITSEWVSRSFHGKTRLDEAEVVLRRELKRFIKWVMACSRGRRTLATQYGVLVYPVIGSTGRFHIRLKGMWLNKEDAAMTEKFCSLEKS